MSNNKLLSASFWTLMLSWSTRFLSIFSVFILARVLSPEDFGVVAIAFIFYHFLVVISDAGSSTYIIKTKELSQKTLDQIWSINFTLKTLLALVLLVSSKFISAFFNNPELFPVVMVYACYIFLLSFSNLWRPLKQREQAVKSITFVGIIAKVVSFIVTISIAIIYHSYWALILGELATIVITIFAGYKLHSYKPRLVIPRNSEIWFFFFWMVGERLLGFFRGKTDSIVIGRMFGVELLGAYTLANRILDIPSNDIMHPLTQPLLSSLAKLRTSMEHLKNRFVSVLYLTNLMFAFICFAILLSGDAVVDILLGEQWSQVKPILQILPLGIYAFASVTLFSQLLILLEHNKVRFWLDAFYTVLIVTLLVLVAAYQDIIMLFQVRAMLYWSGVVLFFIGVVSLVRFNIIVLAGSVLTPFLLAYASYFVSTYFFSLGAISLMDLALQTCVQLLVFTLVYIGLFVSYCRLLIHIPEVHYVYTQLTELLAKALSKIFRRIHA